MATTTQRLRHLLRHLLRNWLRHRLQHRQPDLVRIAWLTRYELASAWVDLRGRCSPRQRALLRHWQTQTGLKLHVASGPRKTQGWINLDGSADADVRLDLRRSLPFASGSVALIFSEHFLDHLQYPDVAGRFLAECQRVLAPGGRLRVVVHDAERLALAYLERDAEFFRVALGSAPPFVESVNHVFRFDGFHKFIYDFETLQALLVSAGFATILRSACGRSELAELNLDLDDPHRAVQSLYVEAVKGN